MKKENISYIKSTVFLLLFLGSFISCNSGGGNSQDEKLEVPDITSKELVNETAYLPSQCYTKTTDEDSSYNPCYTCHTDSIRPNYWDDWDLQASYAMPGPALTNRWTNLFKDKTDLVAAISTADMIDYVNTDNYKDSNGDIIIAKKLNLVPEGWDADKDGKWSGYIPDCYFNFDSEGFDKDKDNNYTGWRAFAYYPFSGTFWPTNGSTDDVIIRLAPEFRQDASGNFSLEVYKLNLALVEALMKEKDVVIDEVDENKYGVDLDHDGNLGTANYVKYELDVFEGKRMYYVGKAKQLQESGGVHLTARLYPEGTEFIHSVRYISTDNNQIGMAKRMKELRYAKKMGWYTYERFLEDKENLDLEKFHQPDKVDQYIGDLETGLDNKQGWVYQGFIEDANGDLRPQSYEETVFCMGCHAKLGATADNTFVFPRKFDSDNSFQRGWYHWTQKSMQGKNEPLVEIKDYGMQYEYSFYLMYNKAGDEFRNNQEVIDKFFDTDGSIKEDMIDALHDDITVLLNPTIERAHELNKAYRTIVQEQSFIYGRDANVKPMANVHESVEQDQPSGIVPVRPIAYASKFNPLYTYFDTELLDSYNETVQTEIDGSGADAPDGALYVADTQGLIQKSSYSLNGADVYFPFPKRHSLPVRYLVPNENISSCYTCHRMNAPVNPNNPVGSVVSLPSSDLNESGKITQLTSSSNDDLNARWSPDGTMIAYVSDSQLWIMNSDGSGKATLNAAANTVQGWPEWSADGTMIVYWEFNTSTSQYSIKRVNADGSGEVEVVGPTSDVLDRPTWHPSGSHIAYAAKDGSDNWDIWIVENTGANPTRLTTATDMETNPLWSPDGNMLSYKNAGTTEYGLTEEFVITFNQGFATSTADRTINSWDGPQSIQMSDWNSDGTKFAYTAEAVTGASGTDKVSYLAVISDISVSGGVVTASNSTVISKGLTMGDRGAFFSPDGTKVAFWGWDKSYRATLWVYEVATEKLTKLTTQGFDFNPQWSPDGSKILFESNRKGNMDLWVISVN